MSLETEFLILCRDGDLEGCKAFYAANPGLNISDDKETAFSTACNQCNLEIAKWLLKIKSDINIIAINESAFTYTCCSTHIGVSKWLAHYIPYYIVHRNHNYYSSSKYRCVKSIGEEAGLWDLV